MYFQTSAVVCLTLRQHFTIWLNSRDDTLIQYIGIKSVICNVKDFFQLILDVKVYILPIFPVRLPSIAHFIARVNLLQHYNLITMLLNTCMQINRPT